LDLSRVTFLDDTQPPPAIDVQAPLLTLPGIFKTKLENIPADVPYLAADDSLVRAWKERLGSKSEFRVGIHWQGNPQYRSDRARSIPLSYFAPLAAVPGVRLISLQKGDGLEQLPEAKFAVEDFSQQLDAEATMVDTAAVIKNLDLVISSDTAVVHLAGALAAPIWVALPFSPDWRWLLERDDNPWYPTMRLFRQPRLDDWTSVFERITAALTETAAAKR
jgi:ADP-heptose:LPS heptosyltransferase